MVYGGMKYTVLPMGRNNNSFSSAKAEQRCAKSRCGLSTSNAQIIPVLRQLRTVGCSRNGREIVFRCADLPRVAASTSSFAKISKKANAARHGRGLPGSECAL